MRAPIFLYRKHFEEETTLKRQYRTKHMKEKHNLIRIKIIGYKIKNLSVLGKKGVNTIILTLNTIRNCINAKFLERGNG